MKDRVVIEQDEDGVFVAAVPSLPGCISEGNTRAEAIENIKEAIAAYIESLQAHNEPVVTAMQHDNSPYAARAVVQGLLVGCMRSAG